MLHNSRPGKTNIFGFQEHGPTTATYNSFNALPRLQSQFLTRRINHWGPFSKAGNRSDNAMAMAIATAISVDDHEVEWIP
jgi:hypothetical protein